jgi:NitT/TauT family transport system ATP-binding protein
MFSPNDAAAVKLNNVRFSYRDGKELYADFSLAIGVGSRVSLMGANGTGKSTLGKMITKQISPSAGSIAWSSDFAKKSDVFYLEQRTMNNVFPWQTVVANIGYPLKKKNWARKEIDERVRWLCHTFRLDYLLYKYPAQLSGGELQRLALARCFAISPKLTVLDESFSALDSNSKKEILESVRLLAEENLMTLVLINHNLQDTMFLSDRCVIIGNKPVSIVSDVDLRKTGVSNNQGDESKAVEEILTEGLRYGVF